MVSDTMSPLGNETPPQSVRQTHTFESPGAKSRYLKKCFTENANHITFQLKAVSKEEKTVLDAKNNFPLEIQERTKNLIGLNNVKRQLSSYFNMFKLNSLRTHYGLANKTMNAHMVFTGNPGTGKTSVARIVGSILKDAGVLASGHVVETSPGDMFSESTWGAEVRNMRQKIQQAAGGVLFIDEAHNIPEHAGSKADYWRNAVIVLMQAMTTPHPQGFAVILAGYAGGIQHLFSLESGLKSRFQTFIHFDDYTNEELATIFEKQVSDAQYKLAAGCHEAIRKAIKDMPQRLSKNTGNARFIQNFFEEATRCVADRILNISFPTKDDVSTITVFDIKAALDKIQKR